MKRERTLRTRMSFRFLMAALVPVCLFAVISQMRLRSSLQDNIDGRISSNLYNANKSLDMVLEKYETILYDMCTDDTIIDTVLEIMKEQDDLDVNSSTLRHELSHICNSNPGVEGITISLRNGRIIFYDRLNSSSTNSVWADKITVPEIGKGYVYQGLTDPVTANERKTYLFQIGRKLIDYRNINDPLGIVVISINQEQIRDTLVSGTDNATYLLQGNTVISSPDSADIGSEFNSQKDTADRKYTTMLHEKSGFTICNEQPLADYNRAIWEQVLFFFVIAVVSCAIMVCLIYMSTQPYLAAVDSLVNAMNDLEEGDFGVSIQIPESMPPEIRRIRTGFINWKAIENEQYDISGMVGALADILRYTVKNAGGTTTVSKELGWLRHYCMLQSAKLGKPLTILEQVPEDMMGYKIHKLLLQPFVENSIKHGFGGKDGDCRLTIVMRRTEEQIHMIIEDNGFGIGPETLKRLNDEEQDMEGHVGIANVRKRLKLYYGDDATIYFESMLGSWTKVHLFVPGKEDQQ